MSTIRRMNCNELNSKSFRYCPRCASGNFGFRSQKLLKCGDCTFEFYFNSAGAVAALIVDREGRILITTREAEPGKGMWDLPGGFIDGGESAEEGLRREVNEELGLDIVSAEYLCSAPNLYEYKGICYSTIDLAYVCRIEDASQARALDGLGSILWERPEEIDPAKLSFASTRNILACYVNRLDSDG